MSVLEPRNRTIGVRLTEDEYAALERFCTASGSRSISDLARTAIWKFVNQAGRKKLRLNNSGHSAQIKILELKLERLSEELASVKSAKMTRTQTDMDSDVT